MHITVTALRDQQYQGRSVRRGDRLDVSPGEAAALRYQGLAALESDGPVEPAPRRRRRYNRRDLTADTT
jgi:hypothetical protein